MATIVVMPQLGNSVESCIIVEWMIAEGDTVAVDQTLASIETDKSTMEVPSTAEGTVLKLLWEEGDEVPVKDPLIIVGAPGEDISGLVPGGDAPAEEARRAGRPRAGRRPRLCHRASHRRCLPTRPRPGRFCRRRRLGNL